MFPLVSSTKYYNLALEYLLFNAIARILEFYAHTCMYIHWFTKYRMNQLLPSIIARWDSQATQEWILQRNTTKQKKNRAMLQESILWGRNGGFKDDGSFRRFFRFTELHCVYNTGNKRRDSSQSNVIQSNIMYFSLS